MRVALFGSPSFAIPSLHILNQHHDVALVVTQPDKPVGRGMKLQSPPTASEAKTLGLRLEQPTKLKNNEAFHNLVRKLELDVCVTAAYGKILPKSLLDTPKHGFLNVHGSLLPKYRGAAPIQWALINGEKETGISIMQTEVGLDTGPVRHVLKLPINENDTSITLFNKLADLGATAIHEALELLGQNKLPSIPQDETLATHSPMLTKDDGRIRWTDSNDSIFHRYQGVKAWPGSWTMHNEKILKVHELAKGVSSGATGQIIDISHDAVEVACGAASIKLLTVQPPNKTKMSAFDWANGYQIKVGDELG